MKKLILLLGICSAYADNQALFNSAMTAGTQNQVNMNLNQGSTIDSYGQTNKFDPAVAQNANAGNAPAKEMFSHISGNNPDNNYLYNNGTAAIQDCMNKKNPRCTTLNKYGDKDTQTQFQAYAQGISSRYAITIKPDPSNSACSFIMKKEPINAEIQECVSGRNAQNTCNTTLTPYANTIPPVPQDGAVLAQNSNQNTEKTYCGITAVITASQALTKMNQVNVSVTSRDDDGQWNINKMFAYGMNGGSYQYTHQNNNNGSTNKTMNGTLVSSTCNGTSCSMSFNTECAHGQLGGNDWNRSASVTLNYSMPKVGYIESGVNFTDNCSQYK